jgi:hypothetical protein
MHVPPGFGKTTTKRRNLRRRLKRQHAKSSIPHTTNPQSLGPTSHPQSSELLYVTPIPVFEQKIRASTLRHKNKKASQYLTEKIGQKIIFPAEKGALGAMFQVSATDTGAGAESIRTYGTRPISDVSRFLAPSERQDKRELPFNVFVTTVSLEEGGSYWPALNAENHCLAYDEDICAADRCMEMTSKLTRPTTDTMTWDEPSSTGASLADKRNQQYTEQIDDLLRAEMDWETAPKITEFSLLQSGQIVGWKVRLLYNIFAEPFSLVL